MFGAWSFPENDATLAKLDFFAGLAPIAYLIDQKSAVLELAARLDIADLLHMVGDEQFLPVNKGFGWLVHALGPKFCDTLTFGCQLVILALLGNCKDIDSSRIGSD